MKKFGLIRYVIAIISALVIYAVAYITAYLIVEYISF